MSHFSGWEDTLQGAALACLKYVMGLVARQKGVDPVWAAPEESLFVAPVTDLDAVRGLVRWGEIKGTHW